MVYYNSYVGVNHPKRKTYIWLRLNVQSYSFFQVRINRSVSAVCFSRFVLMIMVAANLCLWFLTIIKESLHEIHDLHEIKDTNTTPNSSPYPSDPVHEDPVTDNGSSTGNDTQGPVFMAACKSLHLITWWRHQMETFSALPAFVRGIHRSHYGLCEGNPAQRPATLNFDVFFDVRLNKG